MSAEYKLNLDHSNVDLVQHEFRDKVKRIKDVDTPDFAKYAPNLREIKKLRDKYKKKKNIIVEGNGGSISNFKALYKSLEKEANRNVFIVDTDDPDYVHEIASKCGRKDSLVILTSKSGARIQVVANYFAFKRYPILAITSNNSGALNQIRKIKSIDISFHPEIVGRFSGVTECALTPAEIVGIDTKDIVRGAGAMHAKCNPSSYFEHNLALKMALVFEKLEELGYTEIFLSIYSKKLSGFFDLIVQLFHESVCKNKIGQTIYGGEAPENQHHTLQRFVSGRRNCAGLFLTVRNFAHGGKKIKVDNDLEDVRCRNLLLGDLDNVSFGKIIDAEFRGTWLDIVKKKIPAVHLEIESVSAYSVGGVMALFQWTAFYSALIRNVNPCDQPGVEKSKEYIFGFV